MELTDDQKKNLESIQAKVKTLSQIGKVKKALLTVTKQKEKLEEKLETLFDSLGGDASDEKKKDLSEKSKRTKESKDGYDQGSEDNLLN